MGAHIYKFNKYTFLLQRTGAVFFDRDGVINEITYNDDIEQPDSPFAVNDFVYRPGRMEDGLPIS